jgi:stalled ribosome rescue protein Dom34
MARRGVSESEDASKARRRPATTPEEREDQLISAAFDLAQRQIDQGTASAQVITHFLKAGARRERLEQERIARENHLLEVRAERMASERNIEELYKEAIDAMKRYSGQDSDDQDV